MAALWHVGVVHGAAAHRQRYEEHRQARQEYNAHDHHLRFAQRCTAGEGRTFKGLSKFVPSNAEDAEDGHGETADANLGGERFCYSAFQLRDLGGAALQTRRPSPDN